MKHVLFLISHIGSGSNYLFDVLNNNPRIQGYRLPVIYDNYLMIEQLTTLPHKNNDTASIWMDELLFSHQFGDIYNLCSTIFVVREAKPTLNILVTSGYSQRSAVSYYKYRLRRMCEVAKRTKNGILLTWENIISGKGLPLIEIYLKLKTPLKPNKYNWDYQNQVDVKHVDEAQHSYERHLWFLKQYLRTV